MDKKLDDLTLDDLLKGITKSQRQRTDEDRQWLDSEPVGKEFLANAVSDADCQSE